MNTRAIDEFKEASGSVLNVGRLLRVDPDTVYRYLAGERQHYDLEWALTQDIGQRCTERVLALIRGTGIDDREVWLEAKKCPRCRHYDFFRVHGESITGRTLYLECSGCKSILRYIARNPGNTNAYRTDLDTDTLIAEYQAGATLKEMAEKHGTHKSVIRYRLVSRGVEMRPRTTTAQGDRGRKRFVDRCAMRRQRFAPDVIALSARGLSVRAIGMRVGVSRPLVKRILREQGAA